MDWLDCVADPQVEQALLPEGLRERDNTRERAVLRAVLRAALRRLDAEERALIGEVYLQGKTQTQIAGECGVVPSCVSKRLRTALAALRGDAAFALEAYREAARALECLDKEERL